MEPLSDADLEFLQQTFELCRFHKHLGLTLHPLERGHVEVTASYRGELDQAMGFIHGGVFAALLDTATYYAALSHYGSSGRLPLTQECKLNLLATARHEDLLADARLLKAGRSVAVAEAKIYGADRKLLAAGMASLLIPQS